MAEEQQNTHQLQHQRQQQQLGRADSTIAGDAAAKKFYNTFRALRGKETTFDQMLASEIEADNLEMEIVDLMIFISNNPIPVGYGKSFKPPGVDEDDDEPNDEPVKVLTEKTLLQYVGNIVQQFRHKFPNHEEFVGLGQHDSPEFWTRLQSRLGTALHRYHLQIGSDYYFGDTEVRPIYSTNNYLPPPTTECNDYVSLLDLRFILKKLISTAKPADSGVVDDGPLQRRAIILMTFMCVARGGEVKFIDTSRFMYHPFLGCTDFVWTEMKTMNRYSMPVYPNKSTYETDVYHALGSWWLVEGGLHRTAAEQGYHTFLFPSLHRIRNDSVTKKITTIIRDTLPERINQQLRKGYSAKSLRKGSVTQLMMTPGLALSDICGRSGHSTGANIDSYADKRNVMLGLRGGKALAEWTNVNAPVHVPRFECLFEIEGGVITPEIVDKYIDKMFAVSIEAFMPGNHLYAVLRICAASLIMYHNQLTAKHPTNPITSKLLRIAREMNMTFKDLDHWSSIITQDFCSRNPEVAPPTDDFLGLTATLSQVVSQVNMHNTKLDHLVTQCRSRDGAYELVKDETSRLHDQLAQRDAALAELREKLAEKDSRLATFKRLLQSPDGSGQRVRQRLEGTMDSVATSTPTSTPSDVDGVETMGANNGHEDAVEMDLHYGAEAEQVNSSKKSLKGRRYKTCLFNATMVIT